MTIVHLDVPPFILTVLSRDWSGVTIIPVRMRGGEHPKLYICRMELKSCQWATTINPKTCGLGLDVWGFRVQGCRVRAELPQTS